MPLTDADVEALRRASTHNVGWLDVPLVGAEEELEVMRHRVSAGWFAELGRLPVNSPTVTFKITEQGRAVVEGLPAAKAAGVQD